MISPFGNPLDALIDKTVNHEAERAVIAALMRNPDGKAIIRLGISADLFDHPAAQNAFVGIATLIADGVAPDAATLQAALSPAALIEVETSLQENASAANLPVYVSLLKACKRERAVQAARQRLAKAAAAGAPDHELQAILESIRQAAKDEAKPARFIWAQDFCQNTALQDDLIDGYIPAASVGVIFGDSQAYKSFLLIDIAGHIAIGRPWRGHEVKHGKVLFIAGEGGNGLRVRIAAWFCAMGEPIRDFGVSTVPLELCDPKNADLLIADIKEFVGDEHFSLIVLDTLNTHFGPGDENATADMSRFRNGALRLSQSTGATVAISHHCGLADKGRGRGSISLKNGIDWEFKLERSGDFTTLSSTKVKDGPPPAPLSWRLAPQPLPWADKKGNPINGAVLTPVESVLTPRKSTSLPRPQRIALDTLVNIIPSGEDHALIGDWRTAALAAGITQSESKQGKYAAFSRAVEGLIDAGEVKVDSPRCYPIAVNKRSTNGQHVDSVDSGNGAVNESTKSTHPYRGVDSVDRDAQPQPVHAGDKPLSPIAKTILATVTREGIAPDDLKRAANHAHPKAGPALIESTINALLLSGKIGCVNGRLVAGGETAP